MLEVKLSLPNLMENQYYHVRRINNIGLTAELIIELAVELIISILTEN